MKTYEEIRKAVDESLDEAKLKAAYSHIEDQAFKAAQQGDLSVFIEMKNLSDAELENIFMYLYDRGYKVTKGEFQRGYTIDWSLNAK